MDHLPSHNEAKGIWRLCLRIFMCALVLLAPLRRQQHEYCMRRITAETQTPMVNYEWIKWEFILWLQLLRNSCWWMSNQLMIRASREEKQEGTKRKKEWKNEQGQSESWVTVMHRFDFSADFAPCHSKPDTTPTLYILCHLSGTCDMWASQCCNRKTTSCEFIKQNGFCIRRQVWVFPCFVTGRTAVFRKLIENQK